VGQTSTHRPQPTHFELSKLTLNVVNLKQRIALVIAASQVFARDDGDCAVLARLLADPATDTQSIVHIPGLAVNHFKKSIGTIQNALKAAGTFFAIDFYSHLYQIPDAKSQIQITKNLSTHPPDELFRLNQMTFLEFADQTTNLSIGFSDYHLGFFLTMRSEYFYHFSIRTV
jgi:hypothetical protein